MQPNVPALYNSMADMNMSMMQPLTAQQADNAQLQVQALQSQVI